ncbi:hypothetical protein HMPREF1985_00759 [Mitsuokella sp. oral taxon 131 str. W9106]|nr:hypothetical protein HMPREF1985_00759 [Mitsuokella sp. oral taxon 131 str. W9106]
MLRMIILHWKVAGQMAERVSSCVRRNQEVFSCPMFGAMQTKCSNY